MSNETQGAPQPSTLLDRSDVRVKHATGIGGAVAAFVNPHWGASMTTTRAATAPPSGQLHRRQNHAGRAESALQTVLFPEALLHRMQPVPVGRRFARKPFNRGDFRT